MSEGLDAEFYFTGRIGKVPPQTYVDEYSPEALASRIAAENQHLRHRIAVLEKELALAQAAALSSRQGDQPK